MVTVFLIVLVLALILGNVMLSFLKPGQEQSNESADSAQSRGSEANSVPIIGPGLESERIRLLKARVDRLEKMLLKANSAEFVEKKIDSTVLGKRLRDMNEFKDNTKLEIAALKQDLAGVKRQVGIKQKPREAGYKISDKNLHNLVFRSTAGKSN